MKKKNKYLFEEKENIIY